MDAIMQQIVSELKKNKKVKMAWRIGLLDAMWIEKGRGRKEGKVIYYPSQNPQPCRVCKPDGSEVLTEIAQIAEVL